MPEHSRGDHPHAIAHAACAIATDLEFRALCAFTQSGYTARLVAKERPRPPVFAFTNDRRVYNRLALCWGVTPLLLEFDGDTDSLIQLVQKELVTRGLAAPGDSVIIVGGSPIAVRGATNFLKVQKIAAP